MLTFSAEAKSALLQLWPAPMDGTELQRFQVGEPLGISSPFGFPFTHQTTRTLLHSICWKLILLELLCRMPHRCRLQPPNALGPGSSERVQFEVWELSAWRCTESEQRSGRGSFSESLELVKMRQNVHCSWEPWLFCFVQFCFFSSPSSPDESWSTWGVLAPLLALTFAVKGVSLRAYPKTHSWGCFYKKIAFSTCFQPRRTGDGLCVCHPGWGGSDCERCAEGGLESVVAKMLLRWLLQREVTSQRLKQLRQAARLFVPSSGKRRCGDACLLLSSILFYGDKGGIALFFLVNFKTTLNLFEDFTRNLIQILVQYWCPATNVHRFTAAWYSLCVCVSNPVPKGIFILFCRRTFKQEVLHA